MDANIKELEKKIGMNIEAVRDIMLDRLYGVDRKLTVIQVLLKNLIESNEYQDKGKGVVEMRGFGGPLHEFGPMKPLQAEIPLVDDNQETDIQIWGQRGGLYVGDRGRHGPPREAGNSYGWLSLYTPPEPDVGKGAEKFSMGKRVVKTGQDDIFKTSPMSDQQGTKKSWTGSLGSCCKVTDKKEEGGKEVQTRVMASWGKIKDEETDILIQDDSFKSSSMSEQWDALKNLARSSELWDKVADKTDAGGEEQQARILAFWGEIKDGKTDFLLQDFSKPDQWAKNDSGWWGKAIQRETNCNRASVESDIGPKRKHPDSRVSFPNDGPGGPFTTSKRRLEMFTADEQEIFSDIETIMKSIRRIMHQKGYGDGDPLSADDQTYILENVFDYHPEKAQKMGAATIDYIMISKHMKFQGNRCFYIVYTNGRKEDFSYHKCLKSLIIRKYPNKVNELFTKYTRFYQACHPEITDHGVSGFVEAGTSRSRSWLDRETRVTPDEV